MDPDTKEEYDDWEDDDSPFEYDDEDPADFDFDPYLQYD